MNMYLNNLSTALNQSDERDQALQEKLLEKDYTPNNKRSWLLTQVGRLIPTMGFGLVAGVERLKHTEPKFPAKRHDTYAQETT